jgi:phosphohistidine phosphatase
MLRLLLLRHAKSDWSETGMGDHDRPLAARGLKAARRMGRAMARRGWRPASCLTSTARRARDTARLVLDEMPENAAIAVKEIGELYDFGSGREVELAIARHGDTASPLLVVAHNPAIHALSLRLAAKGRKAEMAELRRKFPTGALAVIDFEIATWADLPGTAGRLAAFLRPKALTDEG